MIMKKKILVISLVVAAIAVAVGGKVFLDRAYVVPVLMYHSVDHNDKLTKLSVSPESFEKQMKFLHDNKYNVVGLDKIIDYLQKKEKVPPRTVAITFDDGYYNNYRYAYPVLKKYAMPATIFVIVGKIGQPGWLGWKEIREMSGSGIVTIGSHTVSHLWLPTMGTVYLKKELADSKRQLESHLGRSVDFFCYPIGAHDERVKNLVKEAGYACAVATNPGRLKPAYDIYAIKRVRISRSSDNLLVFWFEISGFYTMVKEYRDIDANIYIK
jgi:peptidoglycan/xylan/chitin deacetylase (PgdA/CDA1 family)